MALQKNQNPNHPKLGSSIKVEPIRELKDIKNIKKLLADHPRNLCLFTLGINTAYRANELLSIRIGQVRHLQPGDTLDLKQSKNKKYRMTTVNQTAIDTIQNYIAWKESEKRPAHDDDFLFTGQRGPITENYLNNLVKDWCQHFRIPGNYGSHTLRKTFGYQARVQHNVSIPILVDLFGHSSQKQTLDYLCIQANEVKDVFMNMNL